MPDLKNIAKNHKHLCILKKDKPIKKSFLDDLRKAYIMGKECYFNYGSNIPAKSGFPELDQKDRQKISNLARNSKAARKAVYSVFLFSVLENAAEKNNSSLKCSILGAEIQQQLTKALLWLPQKEREILLQFSDSVLWKIIRPGAIATEKIVLALWDYKGKILLPHIKEDILDKIDLICTFTDPPTCIIIQVKGYTKKSKIICTVEFLKEEDNIKWLKMDIKVGLYGLDINIAGQCPYISKAVSKELKKAL